MRKRKKVVSNKQDCKKKKSYSIEELIQLGNEKNKLKIISIDMIKRK